MKLNRASREYFAQEEAVAAAKSKAAKKAKRKKASLRFREYIARSIINLRMNGNPNAADAQEKFWTRAARRSA